MVASSRDTEHKHCWCNIDPCSLDVDSDKCHEINTPDKLIDCVAVLNVLTVAVF